MVRFYQSQSHTRVGLWHRQPTSAITADGSGSPLTLAFIPLLWKMCSLKLYRSQNKDDPATLVLTCILQNWLYSFSKHPGFVQCACSEPVVFAGADFAALDSWNVVNESQSRANKLINNYPSSTIWLRQITTLHFLCHRYQKTSFGSTNTLFRCCG